MGEARDSLKSATEEAHRRLDDSPLVVGLAAGSLPDSAYLQMLRVYLAFYEHWEAQINTQFSGFKALAGPGRFEKADWLREDIASMEGAGVRGSTMNPGPVPVPASRAAAMGAWYVVEGSSIGGMHLWRSGKLPENARRFFTGYGAETMTRWKEFIAVLEDELPDESGRREAAAEAMRVFDWFESQFRAAGAP